MFTRSAINLPKEPIWMKSGAEYIVGAGPGRFWARSEPGEFSSVKQRTVLPIFRRPNFTKFEHNTSIIVAVKTFGT